MAKKSTILAIVALVALAISPVAALAAEPFTAAELTKLQNFQAEVTPKLEGFQALLEECDLHPGHPEALQEALTEVPKDWDFLENTMNPVMDVTHGEGPSWFPEFSDIAFALQDQLGDLISTYTACEEKRADERQRIDDVQTENAPCVDSPLVSTLDTRQTKLIEQIRAQNIAEAKKDLKGFCEWNRMAVLMEESRKSDEDKQRFLDRAATGREKSAIDLMEKDFSLEGNPWMASLSGPKELKDEALKNGIEICFPARPVGNCSTKTLAEIKAIYTNALQVPPEPLNQMSFVAEPERKAPVWGILGACGYLNVASTLGCAAALKENVDTMLPTASNAGDSTTAKKEVAAVVGDERYTQALKSLILKMIDRIQNPAVEQGANLFDDLKTAFVQNNAGLNAQEQEKAVWQTLAALASSGPNVSLRVNRLPDFSGFGDPKNANAAAIATIARLIPPLDTAQMAQAHPSVYSLPKGVSFPCDSGKTYHFWLTAYLAWKEKQEGVSTRAATAAAFGANLGYQLMAGYVRETSTDQLVRKNRFNPVENSMRIDMTLAAAGARFGVDPSMQSGKTGMNLGDSLIDYIADGGVEPSFAKIPPKYPPAGYGVSMLQEYSAWLDNFHPRWIYQHEE